ncbi:hypothetical protein T8J41_14035 [Nitratireductor rhodophyticola]|uniref:hypothetical protein n=1 Tax=Nitratireductor rhodophyticola TaxID=2854036 RepID=UPI002AC8E35B|nr:hypothetical protein [Nitratireductor rhodophyticola]WPZ13276.1 hypothetical protein T8J41_14035 [Nitratireductor rhodophyticola]
MIGAGLVYKALFSKLGQALAVVVGASVIVALIYFYGHHRGAVSERQAILSRSVEVLRERNETDEEIRDMDAVALCRALGGLPDECAGLGL